MKKFALFLAAIWLAGCLLGKDDKKEQPSGVHKFTISGLLSELRYSYAPPHDYWFLRIDSIFAGYSHMWDQEAYGTFGVCGAQRYLGNADTTDYPLEPVTLGPDFPFVVPHDTTLARNFTRWRLEITCADSIPVPPQ